MEMDRAVDLAFEAQQVGSGLVRRLLSPSEEIKPGPGKRLIVVFTGYGLEVAEHARNVRKELLSAPIYVFGPDNLSAAAEAHRAWDAVTYQSYIRRKDQEENIAPPPVVADASKDTQFTPGQAAVAARVIEQELFKTALLVTAAYHQPRAYMTLLRALTKRGIDKCVKLFPRPYRLPGDDWAAKDRALKDEKPWARAFAEEELPKILAYQQKGDVSSWKELEECLERLRTP